jgi:hypothetical protein
MSPNPIKCIGFGAIDVTKPCEFIGFGAMDVTKPYEFIGFGARELRIISCYWPQPHRKSSMSNLVAANNKRYFLIRMLYTPRYTPTPVRPGSKGRKTTEKLTPGLRPVWCCCTSFWVPEGSLAGFVWTHFFSLAGPGGRGKPSKRWGASPPTFWKGLRGLRGRPDPKNDRPPTLN